MKDYILKAMWARYTFLDRKVVENGFQQMNASLELECHVRQSNGWLIAAAQMVIDNRNC